MFVMFLLPTVCSAQYALHQNKAAGNAVIVFIFLYYGFYDIAFSPLIVAYTVEILPYHIRAKGFNCFNFVISLSLIFNQYVNPVALAKIAWKYYIVYVVWILFEFVYCYLFVVETKNVSLLPCVTRTFANYNLFSSELLKKQLLSSMVKMLSKTLLIQPPTMLTSSMKLLLPLTRKLVTTSMFLMK